MKLHNQQKNSPKSRRKFIKNAGMVAAGFTIVPRSVLGKGYVPPSDKVNVAGVGIGGRGGGVVEALKSQNIVALCDVDDVRAASMYSKYPKAARYRDFRKMLEQSKDIDAVVVATPDHTHAVIALAAMQLGKHVYVEKPLTHNIYEARLLTKAARQYKVVTQMGNQGSSMDGTRETQEILDAGFIGDVTRFHVWTNRPVWPQGVPTPAGKLEIPKELDWDLWLGPAKYRDYNKGYHPFSWRGWWDFGTGSLGDMGCHFLDTPFLALKLGYPVGAEASAAEVWSGTDPMDSCPPASIVHVYFPTRGEMPPVEMVWYDGGLKPARPEELGPNEPFGTWDGGVLFEGTKGKLLCEIFGGNPQLLPTKLNKHFKKPDPVLPRIKESHQMSWIKGITDGTPTASNFDFAGPFTEAVLMGNLAVRCHVLRTLKPDKKHGDWDPYDFPGRVRLDWDGENMRVTNLELANNFVTREYRKGWEI